MNLGDTLENNLGEPGHCLGCGSLGTTLKAQTMKESTS